MPTYSEDVTINKANPALVLNDTTSGKDDFSVVASDNKLRFRNGPGTDRVTVATESDVTLLDGGSGTNNLVLSAAANNIKSTSGPLTVQAESGDLTLRGNNTNGAVILSPIGTETAKFTSQGLLMTGLVRMVDDQRIYWGSTQSLSSVAGNDEGDLTLSAHTDVVVFCDEAEVARFNEDYTVRFASAASKLEFGGTSTWCGGGGTGNDFEMRAADDILMSPSDDVVVNNPGRTAVYARFDGGTERFGIGLDTSVPSYPLHVVGDNSTGFVAGFFNDNTGSNADGILIDINATAAGIDNRFIIFQDQGGHIGWVRGDGTGVYYSETSDRRLKTDITDAPSLLPVLMNVRVAEYGWKKHPGKRSIGFIAQELAEVWPQAASDPGARNDRQVATLSDPERPEKGSREELVDAARLEVLRANPRVKIESVRALTEDDRDYSFWGVDYGKLTPLLVKAVQEQQAIIEGLLARVAALEAR